LYLLRFVQFRLCYRLNCIYIQSKITLEYGVRCSVYLVTVHAEELFVSRGKFTWSHKSHYCNICASNVVPSQAQLTHFHRKRYDYIFSPA
jgi:hypothetical protein